MCNSAFSYLHVSHIEHITLAWKLLSLILFAVLPHDLLFKPDVVSIHEVNLVLY